MTSGSQQELIQAKTSDFAPARFGSRLIFQTLIKEPLKSWLIALRTINPARRLENAASRFKRKGSIRERADADILVFDPVALEARASVEDPYQPSNGYNYIIVNGKIVIDHDKVTGTYSGTRILGTR